MIRLVSWNIAKRSKPVDWLLEMGLDAALLQECHPDLLEGAASKGELEFSPHLPLGEEHYDRWPMVVRLSDRVRVEWFRQTVPQFAVEEDEVSASGIGVIEVARLLPADGTLPFVAASIYARWIAPHPTTNSKWGVGYQDGSAHAAITDLSAFIGHKNPATHRIVAAGDFNTIRGATESNPLALPARDNTIFDRMEALGLEFLGPNAPNGRQADPVPRGLPADTKNVPTYHSTRQSAETAANQLDYVFASRGFDQEINVRAMNEVDEWGPSDHCRLLIEVGARRRRKTKLS